jgi:hypothetical protein
MFTTGNMRARLLGIITAALFFVSLVFPITAALVKDTSIFPVWWGALDVVLAFLLAILAFVVYGIGRGRVTCQTEQVTFRAYRVIIHGIFVLLLVFFLAGEQITWINGLPGIGWRSWLLLYVLPEWLAVVTRKPDLSP